MKHKSPLVAFAALSLIAGAPSSLFAGLPAPSAEWLAGVSPNGRLVMFTSDNPKKVTQVKIRGLQKKEKLVGIDMRPATGELYGLGSTSRLYVIDWQSGIATQIGGGPFSPALTGTSFSFDFNPTVDRIRIMGDDGQNLRAHPDTGAVVAIDGTLAFDGADANAGAQPNVVACAYTNSDNDPNTGTELYDIDATLDILALQNPPNAGTLNTVGSLGVDVAGVAGFDIAVSTGTGYASLIVKKGRGFHKNRRPSLFTIDLATGAATDLGKIGGGRPIGSLTALGPVAD